MIMGCVKRTGRPMVCLRWVLVWALVFPGLAGAAGERHVAVIDPELDLARMVADNLAEWESHVGPPLVELGPRLVSGQGAHPDNHTLIKIHTEYGIPELQFLAYPSAITGGVRVRTGEVYPPETQIVAAPLASTATREIRIFDAAGLHIGTLAPEAPLEAPFVLAVGNFLPEFDGDEIAVASRYPVGDSAELHFYRGGGSHVGTLSLPGSSVGDGGLALETAPTASRDLLLVTRIDSGQAWLLGNSDSEVVELPTAGLPDGFSAYPSVFLEDLFAASAAEPMLSTLWRMTPEGAVEALDAGWRENRFWIDPHRTHSGDLPVYTFSGDSNGWNLTSTSMIRGVLQNRLVLQPQDAQPFDPYVYGPVENYDGDALREFAMSVSVSGAPEGEFLCRVFWFGEDGHNRVPFNLSNGDHLIRRNLHTDRMDASPEHSGPITRIRLDIPDAPGHSYDAYQDLRVEIDWIAITDDPNFEPEETEDPWGDYVRPGLFRHIRTDTQSPGYRDASDFDNDDFEYWAGGDYLDFVERSQSDYALALPSVWEPTTSHRHPPARFEAWQEIIDPDTGLPAYAALTRLNNTTGYEEVGNQFAVMSWAPKIPALERVLVWPLRRYLHELADKFRGEELGMPEHFIALEPNHEFEINVRDDSSIGEYNPAMITAFLEHLLRRYDSLGNINSRFGTSFNNAADFDAPRNQGRGAWDSYGTDNDFFLAWVDHARRVINYRIAQGHREALLAGFPPEFIKTHQIPANYAVRAAEQNGRITPVDWALSAGTSYGGTRYGVWYNRENNWIQGAFTSGHTNIVIGEYHPLTTNFNNARNQIEYLYNHGVQFIHHMTWYGDHSNDPTSLTWDNRAREAFQDFAAIDTPRPGTTGGVGEVRPVHTPEGRAYNIVHLGHGPEHNGLLKSVHADGSWEGSVYVTPFHAQVVVEPLAEDAERSLGAQEASFGPVQGLMNGDQLEVQFFARSDDTDARLTVAVLHAGMELTGQQHSFHIDSAWRHYRHVLRVQHPMEGVTLVLNSGERGGASQNSQGIALQDFGVYAQRQQVTRYEYGINQGTPHRGGVSFDVLSVDYKALETQDNPFPDMPTPTQHSADLDEDGRISLSELLRGVQLYNAGSYHCDEDSEDGYAPGPGDQEICVPHASDYAPRDWQIRTHNLLRLIQLYNAGGYHVCPEDAPPTEDGYCFG